MYLTNPFVNNPLLAGIVFQYPPARIPLYTLRPFGTTRATEQTTSRTTSENGDDDSTTETLIETTTGGDDNGGDEEFRQ